MTADPEVSVIVRAFNEERHLPRLLKALVRQSHPAFEIILVDSGSTDSTRDIATQFGLRILRISSHDFTFGYSLNVGIRAARGRFAAIVSAHTEPCGTEWLAKLVGPLRKAEVAMTYGRQFGVQESKFGEIEDFRRTFGPHPVVMRPSHFFANNANSAIRRDLWEEYPFDEKLTGLEDIDFAKYWVERGYQVVYEPDAPIYHIHEETWRQVRRRYYREAVAARLIGIRRPASAAAELGREAAYLLADLGRAFRPGDNAASARLPLPKRLGEIALFRINKGYGTISGLLEPHPPQTPQEKEDMLFDRTGRAVVITRPGHAVLTERPIPDLKPGDVLIHVAHVAVCATDLEILEGSLGYFKSGLAHYPQIPGHEFSGRVAAVGQNVTGFTEGDPVVVECIQSCGICLECNAGNFIGCAERTELGVFRRDGAYGDYVVVPARFTHHCPPSLDLRKAALAEPAAVILKGLRRLDPLLQSWPVDARIGVVGAGPLGQLCVHILRQRGWDVIAFDRSPVRLDFLKSCPGVETTTDLARASECKAIIEVTGSPEALDCVLHASPAGCAILLLGLPYGARPFSFEAITSYDKLVVGSVGSTAEDFKAALELLPTLQLDHHLRCSFPLEHFAAAWEASRREDVLKVILDIA